MINEEEPIDERIPLIKVVCSNCGAEIFVPECIDFDVLVCPCCDKPTQP
jgi:hypothetical protein